MRASTDVQDGGSTRPWRFAGATLTSTAGGCPARHAQVRWRQQGRKARGVVSSNAGPLERLLTGVPCGACGTVALSDLTMRVHGDKLQLEPACWAVADAQVQVASACATASWTRPVLPGCHLHGTGAAVMPLHGELVCTASQDGRTGSASSSCFQKGPHQEPEVPLQV